MNNLIQEWLDAVAKYTRAYHNMKRAEKKAEQAPMPKKLRPATAADIIQGAIIWYPPDDIEDNYYWKSVGEVRFPNDPFKAYTAHDGCRYGLDGAFVEDTQQE